MSIYAKLLEEVKNNKINYERVEKVLKQIEKEIEKGNFPSREDYTRFEEALQIVEAKHSIMEEKIIKIEGHSFSHANFRTISYAQSIDELWMRHIDNISKLRESVAFERFEHDLLIETHFLRNYLRSFLIVKTVSVLF
jgi:preprotein translocase subunit SecA